MAPTTPSFARATSRHDHSAILSPSNSSRLQLLIPKPLRINKRPRYLQRHSRRSSRLSINSQPFVGLDGSCDRSLNQHRPTHPLLDHAHAGLPTTALTLPLTPPLTPKRQISSTSTEYHTCASRFSPVPPPTPSPSPLPLIDLSLSQLSSAGLDNHEELLPCALCHQPLASSTHYSFPAKSPLLLHAISCLLPTISINSFSSPLAIADFNFTNAPPLHFCLPCFTHLASLRLCWTCGEPIVRVEERVVCGWACWHWACVACLICRAPVKPPPWIEGQGGGEMRLGESPGCERCRRWIGGLMEAKQGTGVVGARRVRKKPILSDGSRGHDEGVMWRGRGDEAWDDRVTRGRALQHSSFDGPPTPPPTPSPTPSPSPPLHADFQHHSHGMRNGQRIPTRAVNEIIAGFELGPPKPVRKAKTKRAPERRTSLNVETRMGLELGVKYPPLPKWMEKLPGNVRRSRDSGASDDVR